MPVFNLELKFDDKGALEAVNQIDRVTDATNGATNATDELGKKGTKNLDELADSASNAARSIDKFKRETEQASRNVGEISVSAANTSKVVDQLGKSVQEAIDKLSGISPVTDKATDSTEKLLVAVRKMDDIAGGAQKAEDALNKTGTKGSNSLKKLKSQADIVQKALKFVGSSLKVWAIPATLVASMVKLVSSSSELQGELNKLESQFNILGARAGWTKEEMSGLEKVMIQNGIGAVEARKNVMALTSAYVQSSQAAPLLQAALDATVVSGKSVEDTFKNITQAIQSGNSKTLESLGIFTNYNQAYDNLAKKLGTTVSALTEQEKAQARIDATLQASTANAGLYEATLTDAERAEKEMTSALTSLKLELADAFGADKVNLVNTLAGAINWLAGVVNSLKTSFSGLGAIIRGELSLSEYFSMDQEQIRAHLKNYTDANWLQQQITRAQAEVDKQSQLALSMGGVNPELFKAEAALKDYEKMLSDHNKKIEKQQKERIVGEKQRENQLNIEKNDLRKKADKDLSAWEAQTEKGRKAQLQKQAKESLALNEKAYKEGVITQEEYAKRAASIEEAKQKKLKDIEKSFAKKSGAGKQDSANQKWKDYVRQIDVLNGVSVKSSANLDKTLDSIEKTGKAAGKSAKEIQEMQKAFTAATEKKSIQDLNKELLQLEGNTRELQNIERQEKTDQLRAKIADIRSLSNDERNILLNRVDTAVQQEFKVKDMQTAVDFMKDLESLGGSYGESIAMQNQLIEYQASLYRDNLGPEFDGYVAQWERLKILGNDKSFMAGLERGVRKFGADYGDVANQVEQFTTQMGSTISNTLADAFMKGKFSAQDFFSSLISMAAQAASNAFIGQIFSGVGNIFGGLFSSGNYNGLNASAAQGAANTSGYAGMGMRWSGGSAHGNVFSGGNLSDFSNSIVSRPTFFGFSTHFSKYARGAGLMGEAGPEAIMPLSRTKSGDLGVQMVGGWNASPIVNVKVINEGGNPVDAQSQATPNGMGGFDLEIIISQVEQGIVSRAKQGKSQLMQYQQAAYGMDRAPVIARGRGRS